MKKLRKKLMVIPIAIIALIFTFMLAVTRETVSAFAMSEPESEIIELDKDIVESDLAIYLTNQLAERGELYNETPSLVTPLSTTNNGITEIYNSSIVRNIGFFGNNTTGDCGMVAMGILLQFYEQLKIMDYDYGEFVANTNWDYMQIVDNPTNWWQVRQDRQNRANAFHTEVRARTPRLLGVAGELFDAEDATTHIQHKEGFENYFSLRSQNVNVVPITGGNDVAAVRKLIDGDIPVLITMINYNESAEDGTDTNTEKGKPHVVVAYGYRIVNGVTQFLAHSGWWPNNFPNGFPGAPRGSARWFWQTDALLQPLLQPFLYGYCYLDITSRYNTTPVSGGLRIDGLTYEHVGVLEIPTQINGQAIVAIGNNAFANQTQISQITIPGSVDTLGSNVFHSNTHVVLADSWAQIPTGLFQNQTQMSQITIPASVKSIGYSAFENCTNLKSITFESGSKLETIDNLAFSGCASLTDFTIPSSVWWMGDAVFQNCTGLKSIAFANQIQNIAKFTFYGCGELTNVTIPDSVSRIGDWAFYGCKSLTSIRLPENITSIGEWAFYKSGLTSVTIPSRTTSIGAGAFYGSDLINVTIPDRVTSIGDWAFADCRNLTSVIFPNGLTSIGSGAFYFCYGLTSIIIPKSVTSIGNSAFYFCYYLTIYAEAQIKPAGWHSEWNNTKQPVVWGYIA